MARGDYIESTAAALQSGLILQDLEGVDLDGQNAVVLDVSQEDGDAVVELYLLDSKVTKTVRLPADSAFSAHEPAADDEDWTPYDKLRVNEDIPPIHIAPDEYQPYPDPNHPNSINRTIWGPTLRRSPVYRYYNTMKTTRKSRRRRSRTRRAELQTNPRGYNVPKPDVFVPKIDEEGKPIIPLYPDLIGYNIDPYEPSKLAETAQAFYESYQHIRTNIAPQHVVSVHANMSASEYAVIFADECGLSRPEMEVLWDYMVAIGMFPASEHDEWKQHMRMNALLPTQHDDLAG